MCHLILVNCYKLFKTNFVLSQTQLTPVVSTLVFILLVLHLFRSNTVTVVRLSTEFHSDIIVLNLNREINAKFNKDIDYKWFKESTGFTNFLTYERIVFNPIQMGLFGDAQGRGPKRPPP